ncbi:MAG TPA: thermonuclease family protein, partial [Candidatus Nanoarchaeia archaeon]|nr:thermonuclease family protein [Candidatus Nanoarchaeia archaeon]
MRIKNKILFLLIIGFVFSFLAYRLHFSEKNFIVENSSDVKSAAAKSVLQNLIATNSSLAEILATSTTPTPLLEKEGKSAADLTQEYFKVVKVVDGDTVDVLINGKTERLRLIGINTPETVDPKKPVECFGPEASANAEKLLAGQEVRLAADPSQGDKDMYGRLLRYVWRSDGLFYNLEAVSDGFAFEYTFNAPYQYQAEFKAAQQDAQEKRL